MLGGNGTVRFSGAIGSDAFGENLESQIRKSQIESYLVKQKALPTGTCASMVNCIGHRSLIANLAAAETYKTDFLNDGKLKSKGPRIWTGVSFNRPFRTVKFFSKPQFSETIWKKVTSSQIYYSAGFFLTPDEGLPTLMKIAQHAHDSDKVKFYF